jgi:hypothetical protein
MDLKKILEKAFEAGYDTSLMYNNLGDEAHRDFEEFYKKEVTEQLILSGVGFELPDIKEINSRIKLVVENSFEDYEVIEKREYSSGFKACFNWLKIKQMKSKGN